MSEQPSTSAQLQIPQPAAPRGRFRSSRLVGTPEQPAVQPKFTTITHEWEILDDKCDDVIGVLFVSMLWLPVAPAILAVCLPLLALKRIHLLRRLTLLDFLLLSMAAGNLWGLSVRFIGWESERHLFLMAVTLIEGLSMFVVGASWAFRTAEALRLTNVPRACTLALGLLLGPAMVGGLLLSLIFLQMDPQVWGALVTKSAILLAFCAPMSLWFIALSLHNRAERARAGPTQQHYHEEAMRRIAERRRRKKQISETKRSGGRRSGAHQAEDLARIRPPGFQRLRA